MATRHAGHNPGLKHIFGPDADRGTLSLAAIRRRAQRQLSRFDRQARQELENRGIGIPPAISLISCPQTGLTLEGGHPQEADLKRWIDGNTPLANSFKEVEVLFEMVRTAEAPDQRFSPLNRLHIGLTRAGPVAYFQDYLDPALHNG